MVFKGYMITFSTEGEEQYETIGKLWDIFSGLYGIENVKGLGFGWTNNTIDYCFGFKEDISNEEYMTRLEAINLIAPRPLRYNEITIPDDNWETYKGETNNLKNLYDEVYLKGKLDFEIETFSSDGTCEIDVHYLVVDRKTLDIAYRKMCISEILAILFTVLALLSVLCLVFWIYLLIINSWSISFVNLGLPIIFMVFTWLFHCGMLVNRVNKRKAMAKSILDMRFSDEECQSEAKKYRVTAFVDSLNEVNSASVSYLKPLN